MPQKDVHDTRIVQEAHEREEDAGLRRLLHTSLSGAPATGKILRDRFTTDEIFRRIITTADDEYGRAPYVLFLSGLAAGLSISLSFIGRTAFRASLPEGAPDLLDNLLYPVGFVFIVLGRYQLYTENTLTPVTLVLARIVSIPRLLLIWVIVFAANQLGVAAAALFLAKTGVFSPPFAEAARYFGQHALQTAWLPLFAKGILAGWLVAGMMWLIHAVRDNTSRLAIIYLLMFMIPAADLFHCITGSSEVLYLLVLGETTVGAFLWHFLAPVTLGNTLGGVLLVALLNYGQTSEELPGRKLSWRALLLGEGRHPQPDGHTEAS